MAIGGQTGHLRNPRQADSERRQGPAWLPAVHVRRRLAPLVLSPPRNVTNVTKPQGISAFPLTLTPNVQIGTAPDISINMKESSAQPIQGRPLVNYWGTPAYIAKQTPTK